MTGLHFWERGQNKGLLQYRIFWLYLKCLDTCKKIFNHGRTIFCLHIIRIKSETGLFFFVSWLMAISPENFFSEKNPNRPNFYVPKREDIRKKKRAYVNPVQYTIKVWLCLVGQWLSCFNLTCLFSLQGQWKHWRW
jgi:hypothetical protein